VLRLVTQRSGSLLAVIVVLLLLAPGLGCKTGGMGASPAKSFVVPEWQGLNIRSLAYMGAACTAGDETARLTAEDLIEQALVSGQTRFVVLGTTEARSRASAKGGGDTFAKILKVWRNSRTADQFLVKDVCQKAGVDGLILGDVMDWKKEKVDWNTEGQSSTQVTLRLCIFSGKTGLLAWESKYSKTKQSLKYTPQEATGAVSIGDGTQRVENASRIGPEPPKPEEVAEEVLGSILAAFPPAESRP
jgi:hypothetical protein